MNRREFLRDTTLTTLSACVVALPSLGSGQPAAQARKMTIDLVCGAIGVAANQPKAIELAASHGFESVGADSAYLAALSEGELEELKGGLKQKRLVFGAAGLPVEFRREQATFESDLKALPKQAAGLQRAGVTRVSTWLMPGHAKLPYIQHFRLHATRLREVAKILKDQNLRLGLEYVGPKTGWANQRYPFIHTMAEMKELIAEIGTGNVGFLLDSWHWWHAGDTEADILSLQGADVVAVDLNDAPKGVPKDEQPDNRRELPAATGVIDVSSFLRALQKIGYDGPVRAEPFNQVVNKMSPDEACAAAAAALKKAMACINT